MAAKNGTATAAKKKFNPDEPIYDDSIGEGDKIIILRAYIDIQDVINDYKRKLLSSRGIPFDIENLSAQDPLIQHVVEQPEVVKVKDDRLKSKLIYDTIVDYYNNHAEGCQTDAIILGLITENEFNDEPAPYTVPTAKRRRPGVIDMPIIIPNLYNPVERILKQFLDRVRSIPNGMERLEECLKHASIQINRFAAEVDKDGFQPKPTD